MRTTVTLPDAILRSLKRRAAETGLPFRAVLEETLRRGLAEPPRRRKRYLLRTVRLGGTPPGVAVHKALALAATLEDTEVGRELEQRR